MGKKEASSLHTDLIQDRKKLNKRKDNLLERLEKARESKKNAEERLQRLQARLQKRSARVQQLEEKLRETRRQLEEVHTAARALDIPGSEGEDTTVTASIEIDTSSQDQADNKIEAGATNGMANGQSDDLAALSEFIIQAQDARMVAEVAEQAARTAIERAQVAENRLDQFGAGRHLEHELAQMVEEADRALQVAQKTEQVAREAEQAIWPITLQESDETEDDEIF